MNFHNAVFCNSKIYKLGQLGMLAPAFLMILSGWPLIKFFGILGAVASLTLGLMGGAFCMKLIAKRYPGL
jgi:hypothetical protein